MRSHLCPFFLEFRTKLQGPYTLHAFCNTHNHNFNEYDDASVLTEDILERIKALRLVSKSNSALISAINKETNKNFHPQTIYYQVKKLKTKNLVN